MKVRKIVTIVEEIRTEGGREVSPPARVAVVAAVIENPWAGKGFVEDLAPGIDATASDVGALLTPLVLEALEAPAEAYGKAAIVGLDGDLEHAAAILHPRMGKPMREAIGGGKAIIPSNVKVAVAGTAIDVPLSDRDDVWVFDHIDTITVMVPDAPRPGEIVAIVALGDGGRPRPRIDKEGARQPAK